MYFHIYNRGVNGQDLFFEERNYAYFLSKYARFVHGYVKTFAYCLLKNHFHLLIQVRDEDEILKLITKNKDKPLYWHVSNAFSSFIKSYSITINDTYGRTGQLFEEPFKRKEVNGETYFSSLVAYIHTNPQKHGLVKDFRDYPYSSYHAHLSDKPTKLSRNKVLEWFGGKRGYIDFHEANSFGSDSEDWMLE
ncbi:hypothetical protein R9C00_10450 [Flammeovirgaceae bacterium SG7u.111]|nr:hypothetical protein [Flammeovirgaceae bacterium SG7u.132]WPO37873.1 hypothetical protein R9C00_10450 [Flammeovirgaceae bacterium SG7u.111]